MKKLLSLLGVVSLTATGASSVIACSYPKQTNKQPPKEQKKIPVVESTPQENEINSLTTDKTKLLNQLKDKQKEKVDISLLKIDSPDKIFAKNIRKVSEDEYLQLIKNKIHEALNNFDKSLKWSKDHKDLEITWNFPDWFDRGHLDLSTPKTGTLSIKGINNAIGYTEITITLPIATQL